jgi:hypothetical protein
MTNVSLCELFGLRKYQREAGLSRHKLAELIGVSFPSVYYWRAVPDLFISRLELPHSPQHQLLTEKIHSQFAALLHWSISHWIHY